MIGIAVVLEPVDVAEAAGLPGADGAERYPSKSVAIGSFRGHSCL